MTRTSILQPPFSATTMAASAAAAFHNGIGRVLPMSEESTRRMRVMIFSILLTATVMVTASVTPSIAEFTTADTDSMRQNDRRAQQQQLPIAAALESSSNDTTTMSSTDYWMPLILSLLAGMSTCLGAAVVFCTQKKTKNQQQQAPLGHGVLAFSLALAGSVMVTVSFVSILPESFHDEQAAAAAAAAAADMQHKNHVVAFILLPFLSWRFFERCMSLATGCGLYVLLSKCAFPEPETILGFDHPDDTAAVAAATATTTGSTYNGRVELISTTTTASSSSSSYHGNHSQQYTSNNNNNKITPEKVQDIESPELIIRDDKQETTSLLLLQHQNQHVRQEDVTTSPETRTIVRNNSNNNNNNNNNNVGTTKQRLRTQLSRRTTSSSPPSTPDRSLHNAILVTNNSNSNNNTLEVLLDDGYQSKPSGNGSGANASGKIGSNTCRRRWCNCWSSNSASSSSWTISFRQWGTGLDLTTHEARRAWRVAMLLFVSLAVHNFPEGLAVAASSMHSSHLGMTTAIAIALHNIPEGVAIAVPCLAARPDLPWLAFGLASASGLAEPAGAAVAMLFLTRTGANHVETQQEGDEWLVMGNVLAFVAGIMTMVAFIELFPEAIRHSKQIQESSALKKYQAFMAGTVMGIIVMIGSEMYLDS